MASEFELERRVGRLEALFSAMLLSDGDTTSSSYKSFIERLLKQPKDPFVFSDELQFILTEYPFWRGGGLSERFEALSKAQNALQTELHSYLVSQSMGIDPNLIPLHRFVSVQVYIPDDNAELVAKISGAVEKLLEAMDFEIADDFPAVRNSWFKKWFARTKDIVTQPEVVERLRKFERAIELKQLQETQASIDEKQAKAMRDVMAALETTPNAVCLVGSMLTVKITDDDKPSVYVRSLTPEEMIFLSNNQHLLKSPNTILESLSSNAQKSQMSNDETLRFSKDLSLPKRVRDISDISDISDKPLLGHRPDAAG